MDRKIVFLAFVSTLLLSATFGTQITMPVTASTAHNVYLGIQSSPSVHNINTSLSYPTIQGAIIAPETLDGHIIQVDAGTYYEHVNVDKTVSLIGEDPVTTIIDGGGTGSVVSVTAPGVEIRGFMIQNGGQGMADCGIFIGNRAGNTISNNIIRKNYNGLWLSASNSNKIVDNIIIDNYAFGIKFSDSNNNQIIGNTIGYNPTGVNIMGFTLPSTFYHNNFLNNTNQVFSVPGNYWDNGTEGNYWSDYMGVDTDGDGVGETELWHLGLDQYPLIIPTKPFPVVWEDVIYPVTLLGNSTVSGFYFSQPSKEIGFYVNGLLNKTGFCNVTIPKELLRDSPWRVKADNNLMPFTSSANATHSSLYFTYNHSAQRVQIIGTEVIPEFPSGAFLPLSIIVMLLAATLRKRGRERHRHSSSKPKAIFHASSSYSGGNERKRLMPYALLSRVRR